MLELLALATFALTCVLVAVVVLLWKKPITLDLKPIEVQLGGLERHLERTDRALREELARLTESNERRLETIRTVLEQRLVALQEDNAKKLDEMRKTVDEKLQGALEKRLGESFKLVSERLELVHKGLGEMQSLAHGVGDLKKVLTNVKTRGTWGEIQLGALLEAILSPEQFEAQVTVEKGRGERVDFAIRLPGRGTDPTEVVYLPIDAKFPKEEYERLVDASERGDHEATEAAAKLLEQNVRALAKDIAAKYIRPPHTTDFAILFLSSEGLYAEALRRPGLVAALQRDHRIVIAGPTTLAALLNSLQMGFRTLAIEQRSSEVWKLLAAVKSEFAKFGDTISKVQDKLNQASNAIGDATKRTRVIEKKLRDVELLPATEAQRLLGTTEDESA